MRLVRPWLLAAALVWMLVWAANPGEGRVLLDWEPAVAREVVPKVKTKTIIAAPQRVAQVVPAPVVIPPDLCEGWADWESRDPRGEECTRRLVEKHGLPSVFVEIAKYESGWRPAVVSPTKDFGLFQINRAAWRGKLRQLGWITEMEDLFDPDLNTRVAVLIYNGGKGGGVRHWMVCQESRGRGPVDCL